MILIFKNADGARIVTPHWTVEENKNGTIDIGYLLAVSGEVVYKVVTLQMSMDEFIKNTHWANKQCNGVCNICSSEVAE